jgi:hypothetical protein
MHHLIFDIETAAIPFDHFDPTQQEFLVRGSRNEEERQRQIDMMSLNPFTAQVVAIGMMHFSEGESAPTCCVYSTGSEPADDRLDDGATWRVRSEKEVLEKWWEVVAYNQQRNSGLHLVTFNGRHFDCPFLMLRSALLRVRPTRNLMDGTRWNYQRHTDLADELTFHSNERFGAMRKLNFDFYCTSFGIASPKREGISGYDVPRFYLEGRYREIAEYCLRDVKATRELYGIWRDYLSDGKEP